MEGCTYLQKSIPFRNHKERLEERAVKKNNFLLAVKNFTKNFWLLFSTIAALCLFLSPSLISLMLSAVIFAAVVAVAVLDVVKPNAVPMRNAQMVSMMLTALIVFMGFSTFTTTWTPSGKVAALAGTLGTTTPTLLLIIGAVGCIAGAYAMYVLACWIVSWCVMLLKERLPVQDKTEIKENLKRNWYIPISAMAFFCLTMDNTLGYCVGLLIAFMVMVLVASQIPSVSNIVKQHSLTERILCLLCAIGISLGNQTHFYEETVKLTVKIGLPEVFNKLFLLVSYFGSLCAICFIFVCLLVLWAEMKCIISETGLTDNVNWKECIVYGFLLVASIGFVVASFTQSQAFYGTELSYDIIYTSDSPDLVKGNVYMALTHSENDLRQPLFAVFAAPFVGIPYLLSRLFGASSTVQAILVNSAQILMLFAANFMLAKMLKLDSGKRICFMALTSCTYTHLLFTVMMEQYIVAYFWLVFCMYLIAEKQQPDRIALWGAGGTLLTSMILLPFMSTKSPIRDFKAWFMDMVKCGLEFVALMLVFCRFDVIFNLMSKITQLSGFTGKSVTFMDKIYQYTEFIGSCFVAPNADVNTTAVDHISWQLNTATGINFAGVLILVLVLFSAFWNRDKKSSLLAVGWVGFSVVMLLGLGWGTKENGLILYALYFGWAFLVLLFQLVEKIESKLNVRYLIPIFTVCAVASLLIINIPAIMEMVNFAITYYPV